MAQAGEIWVTKQHDLILAENRWALKTIKQTTKEAVLHVGGTHS